MNRQPNHPNKKHEHFLKNQTRVIVGFFKTQFDLHYLTFIVKKLHYGNRPFLGVNFVTFFTKKVGKIPTF